MMKATVTEFHELGDAWMLAFKTASTQTIIDLANTVRKFYKKDSSLEYNR